MAINIEHFKAKLEQEKKDLETRLSKIAKPNPEEPGDWKTTPEELNIMVSDESELADVFEESANREATETELEERLNKIKTALEKIKDGSYGKCAEGCEIEERRLEANPAAETCIKHAA